MQEVTFQRTGLWLRSLAPQSDELDAQRELLRQSFLGFRDRASQLLNEIGGLLPDLTVHDISHIDALWRVADEIAGPDYPLNPAEAFVLGGTFLLHDAAHILAAYDDGIGGIKKMTAWNDLIAQRFAGEEPSPGSPGEKVALFHILRQLHASQAWKLATRSWKVPATGESLHLLEQFQLRDFYGDLIGHIAASHHWSSHKVAAVFEHRYLSSPAFLTPANWTVDALKVALLLRTSDAAHVDAARAPWFLFALRQPGGISEDHWQFQAKMGQVVRTSRNEIRLSSGSPFTRKDRQAWWFAYDVALLIDRELRDAQAILGDSNRPRFAATGVEHASDPEKFALNVLLTGWEPANIAPKIGDIRSILRNFGGVALYGNHPRSALRELIQNAADAVRALRALGVAEKDSGDIDILLETSEKESWLHVTDSGIGMSRYVLTNVLLDFGTSLWTDESLRTELPGLAAKRFGPVGRFGIGFFSVFMLGRSVSVTTRRFRPSADDVGDQWVLEFDDGLNTRPTLRTPREQESLPTCGTRVSVKLRDDVLEAFYSKGIGSTPLQKFRKLVPTLCPTLDVSVHVKVNSGNRKTVVKPNDWKRISMSRLLDRTGENSFWRPSALLPLRDESGELLGRVGCGKLYCDAVITHGGITAGEIRSIGGVLLGENNSDMARSESRPVAPKEAWSRWADEWLDSGLGSNSETLINLHPICAGRDLAVYGIAKDFVTEKRLKKWLKTKQKVKVLEGYPQHESHDDASQDRFGEEFELKDDALVLPISNRRFIDSIGFSAIDYEERFTSLLDLIWGDYEAHEDFTEFGEVTGEEIFRHVTVYERWD